MSILAPEYDSAFSVHPRIVTLNVAWTVRLARKGKAFFNSILTYTVDTTSLKQAKKQANGAS